MIKVNLLRDQTARARKVSVQPTVSQTGLILTAVFVLAAGGMGSWYFYINNQVKSFTKKRDDLRIEEARLQMLKKEIEKFEKTTRLLQSRIDVIEGLKAKQTGPVLLLNNVLQSIPRDGALWLTALTQKDDHIKIVGLARETETIPDFMSNLAASGMFQSVDLEGIESQKDASKFSLLCVGAKNQPAE